MDDTLRLPVSILRIYEQIFLLEPERDTSYPFKPQTEKIWLVVKSFNLSPYLWSTAGEQTGLVVSKTTGSLYGIDMS